MVVGHLVYSWDIIDVDVRCKTQHYRQTTDHHPSTIEIPSDLDEPLLVLFRELVVAVPVYHGTREPVKLVTGMGVTGEMAIHCQANLLGDGLPGTRAT